MSTSVLYDLPGPKARRRAHIGTAITAVVFVALAALAGKRLADNGQFDGDKWGPLINPANEDFSQVWQLLGKGLANTLIAAALAIVLSLALGILLGVGRMMLGQVLGAPVILFIQLFRGLPVIITIVFVWRAMVELGLDDIVAPLPGDTSLWYLVIGLTLYNSVIIAEILRAGVASLPRGQGEAGLAIGMTPGQSMRSILLPQAFRVMLPALISQFVVALKDTSLAALIGLSYFELLNRGNQISSIVGNRLQTLFVVGLIFILINYGLSRLATWTERRLSRATGSDADMSAVKDVVPAT